MEKKIGKIKMSRHNTACLIVTACTVFWAFLCGIGLLSKFDLRVYDLLLALRKNPETRSEVMILEIDNISLEEIGSWPWTRNIYADALLYLKELGVKTAVFDIEFLSPSEPKVDENALNDAIAEFNGTLPDFSKILVDNDAKLARALQFFGNSWLTVNMRDLDIAYSEKEIDYAKKRFLYAVEDEKNLIERDSRKNLVESLNNSFFDSLRSKKIDWSSPQIQKKYLVGFSPALSEFSSRCQGLGFPNVVIDEDGSRRRVELLNKVDGGFTAQLAFSPMLKILSPKKITRKTHSIVLEECNFPLEDGTFIKKTMEIPLDEKGRMLINWKHGFFQESFKHDNFLTLFQLNQIENNILSVLGSLSSFLDSLNAVKVSDLKFSNLSSAEKAGNLISDYEQIKEFKDFLLERCEGIDEDGTYSGGGIAEDEYEMYFDARKSFFEDARLFSGDETLNEIFERLSSLRSYIGESQFTSVCGELEELFDVLKHETELYEKIFSETRSKFNGTFCIIGHTASSSTDLGTTVFERSYPNVGTHANVYNTIMTEDFIRPSSWIFSMMISVLISLVFTLLTAGKKAVIQNAAGFIGIVTVIAVPVAGMVIFGLYFPSFAAILNVSSVYLAISVYRFASAEKDRKFLQSTFSAYVAPAVVDQIVRNPEIARLGGKTDMITALFSDVKSFSGFTEVINNEEGEDKGAERLVLILNKYLGVLSDAIMENNGTIDKYVGDEIVSFFGAPLHDENSAFDACVAAIRMLQAEEKFNKEYESLLPINPATQKPFYLRSRVGLNTGNMVVGNMGTDKKLNYTIMGNNVNLASRLEGTNKVYGSWIMCSESTWLKADCNEHKGLLIARKLDCVRVINVKRPVPIYSIIGLKSELDENRIKATQIFNEGMEWYLRGADNPENKKEISDFEKALELFKKADELYPADESSKVFMARCNELIKNGVPDVWDGVYVMKSK